jgi:hypothetical protein
MTNFSKAFWVYHGCMGIYGFSRGLRINYEESPRKLLLSERIGSSFILSYYYFIPGINLIPLSCLIKRIEIKTRGLNPEYYKDEYREFSFGSCFYTL